MILTNTSLTEAPAQRSDSLFTAAAGNTSDIEYFFEPKNPNPDVERWCLICQWVSFIQFIAAS